MNSVKTVHIFVMKSLPRLSISIKVKALKLNKNHFSDLD